MSTTASIPEGSAPEPPTFGRARVKLGRRESAGAFRLTWVERIALVVLVVIILAAIIGPWVAPYNPDKQDLTNTFAPLFSPGHVLGTDQLGRDNLSRLLDGTRVSLGIASGAALIALAAGLAIGITAGYRGKLTDAILMRGVDVLLAFPALVLALVIAAGLGPGVLTTIVALGVVFIPAIARVARSLTVREREREYIQAARLAGASTSRIARVHISRNIWIPISAQAVFLFGYAIPGEAALSFVGLGVQPPQASWGNMIAEGYSYITKTPLEMLLAIGAIALTVGSVSILADALRRRDQA